MVVAFLSLQERHPGGHFPDPGPSLAVARRSFPISNTSKLPQEPRVLLHWSSLGSSEDGEVGRIVCKPGVDHLRSSVRGDGTGEACTSSAPPTSAVAFSAGDGETNPGEMDGAIGSRCTVEGEHGADGIDGAPGSLKALRSEGPAAPSEAVDYGSRGRRAELERCQVIPDAELFRVGWTRMLDPLATVPSETTFW